MLRNHRLLAQRGLVEPIISVSGMAHSVTIIASR